MWFYGWVEEYEAIGSAEIHGWRTRKWNCLCLLLIMMNRNNKPSLPVPPLLLLFYLLLWFGMLTIKTWFLCNIFLLLWWCLYTCIYCILAITVIFPIPPSLFCGTSLACRNAQRTSTLYKYELHQRNVEQPKTEGNQEIVGFWMKEKRKEEGNRKSEGKREEEAGTFLSCNSPPAPAFSSLSKDFPNIAIHMHIPSQQPHAHTTPNPHAHTTPAWVLFAFLFRCCGKHHI